MTFVEKTRPHQVYRVTDRIIYQTDFLARKILDHKNMPANCRLCSSLNTKQLFTSENIHGRHVLSREKFGVCECMDCRVTFTDVLVDNSFYSRYYPENYYEVSGGPSMLTGILSLLEKIGFRRKLKMILKHKPAGSRILEIGCAQGKFLNSLPSTFKKFGVEINEKGHQYIRENYPNITVYAEDIESKVFNSPDAPYDVIVMWHVLEHVKDPEGFFRRLATLLSKNGVFIFEVPNRNSLGFRWTQKKWFHLDTPRHLFHYNFFSIKRLLEKHGLQIIQYSGNAIEYWQDLPVSVYKRFLTKKPLSKIIVWGFGIPMSFLARLFSSLFLKQFAEINTYVVKRNPT